MDEMGRVGNIELLQGRESEWHKLSELTPASQGAPEPPWSPSSCWVAARRSCAQGDLLGALTGEGGFQGSQIGKINVTDFTPTWRSSAAWPPRRCLSSTRSTSKAKTRGPTAQRRDQAGALRGGAGSAVAIPAPQKPFSKWGLFRRQSDDNEGLHALALRAPCPMSDLTVESPAAPAIPSAQAH